MKIASKPTPKVPESTWKGLNDALSKLSPGDDISDIAGLLAKILAEGQQPEPLIRQEDLDGGPEARAQPGDHFNAAKGATSDSLSHHFVDSTGIEPPKHGATQVNGPDDKTSLRHYAERSQAFNFGLTGDGTKTA